MQDLLPGRPEENLLLIVVEGDLVCPGGSLQEEVLKSADHLKIVGELSRVLRIVGDFLDENGEWHVVGLAHKGAVLDKTHVAPVRELLLAGNVVAPPLSEFRSHFYPKTLRCYLDDFDESRYVD